MKVVLGVAGSIAAYKACELVRLLVKDGCDVRVVMTAAANCGVALLATIHAADVEELKRKPLFSQLLKLKVFEKAVIITRHGGERCYQVSAL